MPKCKYCDSTMHTSLMCFQKPRRALKKVSNKAAQKTMETKWEWFELNPPDAKGLWYCYLQISPDCWKQLTRSTITLEHVKSKVRYPELKFEVTNLRPACGPCNKLKGSRDLEEIPEWQDQKTAA